LVEHRFGYVTFKKFKPASVLITLMRASQSKIQPRQQTMGRLLLLLFLLCSFFGHDKASVSSGFSPISHQLQIIGYVKRCSVDQGGRGGGSLVATTSTTALFAKDKISRKKKEQQQRAAVKHTPTLVPTILEKLRLTGLPSLANEKLQEYETLYNDEQEITPLPDRSVKLLLHLDLPITKNMLPAKDRIQQYITTDFLRNYLDGARLRKLQRDIAFRMDQSGLEMVFAKEKKLPLESLLNILGEMERNDQVRVRFAKKGKIVVCRPSNYKFVSSASDDQPNGAVGNRNDDDGDDDDSTDDDDEMDED
jgi:hypothetical protein